MEYLEHLGWTVDGIDVSQAACLEARRRRAESPNGWRGSITCADATELDVRPGVYDLVVAYGLAHCLDDEGFEAVAATAMNALSPRGLLALASFNDELPIPADHGTVNLALRSRDEILSAFPPGQWERCSVEHDAIEESHEPVIGEHRHSLTWALFRKKV
jgi:cyclopropane fatty-acyl-phospholipid synthase-like methyltransferase